MKIALKKSENNLKISQPSHVHSPHTFLLLRERQRASEKERASEWDICEREMKAGRLNLGVVLRGIIAGAKDGD